MSLTFYSFLVHSLIFSCFSGGRDYIFEPGLAFHCRKIGSFGKYSKSQIVQTGNKKRGGWNETHVIFVTLIVRFQSRRPTNLKIHYYQVEKWERWEKRGGSSNFCTFLWSREICLANLEVCSNIFPPCSLSLPLSLILFILFFFLSHNPLLYLESSLFPVPLYPQSLIILLVILTALLCLWTTNSNSPFSTSFYRRSLFRKLWC